MHYSCRKLTMLHNSFLQSTSLHYQHQLHDSSFLTPAFVPFLPQKWGDLSVCLKWLLRTNFPAMLGDDLGHLGGRSDTSGDCPLMLSVPLSTGVCAMSGTLQENCSRGKEGYNKERGRGHQRKWKGKVRMGRERNFQSTLKRRWKLDYAVENNRDFNS